MIKRLAAREGLSAKETVLRLVEDAMQQDAALDIPEDSVLDPVRHLVGSIKTGPRDLATNPRYLEGYGLGATLPLVSP
ncbi:MAG: hypothetical protein JJ896_15545 [Rhodothermales bacterium]|nr:hypothetical protein [Rhodothermales bacterium]